MNRDPELELAQYYAPFGRSYIRVDDTAPFEVGQVIPLVIGPTVDERTGFVRPAEERRFQIRAIYSITKIIGGSWL